MRRVQKVTEKVVNELREALIESRDLNVGLSDAKPLSNCIAFESQHTNLERSNVCSWKPSTFDSFHQLLSCSFNRVLIDIVYF